MPETEIQPYLSICKRPYPDPLDGSLCDPVFLCHPIPEAVRHEIALFLFQAGTRPRCSTDVAGNDTRGYGELGSLGWWEFEL